MHPLPGLPLARFHDFVAELQTQAPRLSRVLESSVPVVQQALLGVREGILDPEDAARKVLTQLDPALPPRGHTEHSLVEPTRRQVKVLFKGEAQSLRSDRVRLLVAQRLISSVSVGYRAVLDGVPSSSYLRIDRDFVQALRRLCDASAVLTPPSATTSLMGTPLALEQMLKALPGHFFNADKDFIERGDVNALLTSLQSEMTAVVKGDTRVKPRMLKHEVKMAQALQRQFGERVEELQDGGRARMNVRALHAGCLELLNELVAEASVRLESRTPFHALVHPFTRFAEQERGWLQEDAQRPSAFQLTEAMTRVRVVLNAFAAEASNHE